MLEIWWIFPIDMRFDVGEKQKFALLLFEKIGRRIKSN